MADFKDKISNLLNSQVPDFVLEDHPLFLDFVKAYYQLLESAEITLTNIGDPDHLQLDSTAGATNFLLLDGTNINKDDSTDRILLEDTSFGDFVNGELITGATSGASATILVEDVDAGSRLFVTHQNKFIEGELITGSSSGAQANIGKYRANPVQNIQQLLDYADVDKTISGFLTKFRNSFLTSIPDTLDGDVNKRNLIKNIKSLYQAKGTKRASEIFFKLLFNEDAEIRYPKDNILRVSDGKWNTKKILRCVELGNLDAANLVGQTITQADDPTNSSINKATAVVEDVFKYIVGGQEIVELVLGDDSIDGSFVAGENVTGVDNTNSDVTVTLTQSGIINNRNITNDGALYNEGDNISITGGGTGATLKVGSIGSGTIQEVIVDDGGSGYEIGDIVNFSSGGTTGKVSVVNGGVTLEDDSGQLVLETETMASDSYFGNKVVQESGTGVGDITDIRLINTTSRYSLLPTLTITSSFGSGAKVLAYGTEIGRALTVNVTEAGYDYHLSPAPTIVLPTNILVTNVVGTFTEGDTVTGLGLDGSSTITSTVVSLNTNTNILKLSNASGTYGTDITITSSGGATATVTRLEQATATVDTSAVVTTDGAFLNEDGWISENTMRIQDSLLYQDYSYIIRVARSIDEWRDSYVKTLHSAGFYFQGEIAITARLNAQIKTVTGVNSGITEILRSVLSKLYSTIVGRRLGTETDSTTLRVNAKLGVSADLDDATITQFDKTTRDVTLTKPINIKYLSRTRRNLSNSSGDLINVRQGFAYAGPRLGTIDRFANTAFGTTANTSATGGSSGITFQILNDIQVKHTKTTLDGSSAIFLMTSNEQGKKLKTNFTIPADISSIVQVYGQNSFDETLTTFDNDNITMDTQP